MKTKRIFELDTLRGIAVIAMIIDHFTYFLSEEPYLFPSIFTNYDLINTPWFNSLVDFSLSFQMSAIREIGHFIFVSIFLLLAGISSSFSKNNFKRALKVGIAAGIITLVTICFSQITGENYNIIFGILHLMALSILIFAIVQKIFPNKWLYLTIGVFIVVWGFLINWYSSPYVEKPTLSNIILIILGYNVYGADHFGILPCTGVFFIGAFLGELLYPQRTTLLPKLDHSWHKPFSFIGRHALIFYLLHQVISAIIIGLLGFLAGYRL